MIRRIERADGTRFQVYGKADGKTVYVGTYDSRREANDAEEEHRSDQRKIKRGELAPNATTKRTLKEGLDLWLASIKDSRSHRPYSEFVKYQIEPELGTLKISSITSTTIAQWSTAIAKRYAPQTVNSARGCLSAAFEWFIDPLNGWLKVNPCRGVKQTEVPDRQYNWIKTRGELERLLLGCSDELRDMIAVSVGTAMRIGELLALTWDDVSIDTRLITIQRGSPNGPPKGGKIRQVPILDSVLPVLRARALKRGGSVLVFPGKGGKHRSQTPVTCAFKSALKRAQMDTSLRWHDLRHTSASWWVMSGGDIFRLSKLMGHKSVKVTEKTYAHLAPEAWSQDYARLAFNAPSEPAKVYEIRRDERGKLAGRSSVVIDARQAG